MVRTAISKKTFVNMYNIKVIKLTGNGLQRHQQLERYPRTTIHLPTLRFHSKNTFMVHHRHLGGVVQLIRQIVQAQLSITVATFHQNGAGIRQVIAIVEHYV